MEQQKQSERCNKKLEEEVKRSDQIISRIRKGEITKEEIRSEVKRLLVKEDRYQGLLMALTYEAAKKHCSFSKKEVTEIVKEIGDDLTATYRDVCLKAFSILL